MTNKITAALLVIAAAIPAFAQPGYSMLSITEDGLYYKSRLDVSDWQPGEDFIYVSPYYIPWNGEDSLDYQAGLGELKVNGETVGVDLVEISVDELTDKGKITTAQTDCDGLNDLSALPNLVAASVVGVGKNEDLKNLENLANLRALDLAYTKVTDEGLQYVSNLKDLRALNLSYTDISDDGLKYVSELENLRSLDLESTEITDAGLAHLKKLENLRTLNLFRTKTDGFMVRGRPLKVTDDGLGALAGMPNLKELNLHGALITDKGVETIAGMQNVQKLNLSSTKITDDCIDQLIRMGNLKELNIKGTDITVSGISRLKQELTDCAIEY